MNVLVFGATSGIGQSITNVFAKGNNLILVGRSKIDLASLKKNVTSNNETNVNIIEYDFGTNINHLINKIENIEIDLIINMATATSSFRDDSIISANIRSDVNVDFVNPVLLIQWLISRGNKFDMIFLSSILSKIESPNRVIYSSYKKLQETYLNKLVIDEPNFANLLTVNIGTEIKKNAESNRSKNLAKKVYNNYLGGKKTLFFGLFGRLLWVIYFINPFLFRLIIYLKRKIISLD